MFTKEKFQALHSTKNQKKKKKPHSPFRNSSITDNCKQDNCRHQTYDQTIRKSNPQAKKNRTNDKSNNTPKLAIVNSICLYR